MMFIPLHAVSWIKSWNYNKCNILLYFSIILDVLQVNFFRQFKQENKIYSSILK